MKSKKIVALALTAAMAISAASMTAFAKAEYNTGASKADIKKTYATITLTADDITALKKIYDADESTGHKDSGITDINDTAGTVTLTYKALEAYGSGLEDKSSMNTPTATFLGWEALTTTEPTGAVAGTENKLKETDSITFTKDTPQYSQLIYRDDSGNDEQIKKNIEAINDAANNEKTAKSREEKLQEGDKANKAVDNVKTADGPKTEKAPVTGPTAIEDSADLHDFKVVNKDMDGSALAWVYQVTKPVGLVPGYNARVTLPAPKGYDLKNYKVAVYHVKGYCIYEKVKGLDIVSSDVTFWANDMSPYVLVLTPRDAVAGTSTGNPSTGDFSAVPVAMLAAAALGATGFVAYKKRKAE